MTAGRQDIYEVSGQYAGQSLDCYDSFISLHFYMKRISCIPSALPPSPSPHRFEQCVYTPSKRHIYIVGALLAYCSSLYSVCRLGNVKIPRSSTLFCALVFLSSSLATNCWLATNRWPGANTTTTRCQPSHNQAVKSTGSLHIHALYIPPRWLFFFFLLFLLIQYAWQDPNRGE